MAGLMEKSESSQKYKLEEVKVKSAIYIYVSAAYRVGFQLQAVSLDGSEFQSL